MVRLNGATMFSSLDIKQAFHQLVIKPSCRDITTFVTSRGLFRYKRLLFGISCAPELFQKTKEKIFNGCDGIFIYIDDILVYGRNSVEHNGRLEKVFESSKNIKFC